MKEVMSPLTPVARKVRLFLLAVVVTVAGGFSWSEAADARPVVGPGATRDEAIKAYGWPTGQTQTGSREILSYPQGRIFLEKGKLDRVDFSPTMAWPAPRPRPPGPRTSSLKQVDAPVDFWLTDWVEAQTEAERRHARILILFTASIGRRPADSSMTRSRLNRNSSTRLPAITFSCDWIFPAERRSPRL